MPEPVNSCPVDPYSALIEKLKADEFPTDELEELCSQITGWIRSNHQSLYHEADDVSSEVVVEAYRAINTFRGDSAFFAWVLGIASNLIRKRAKRMREHPEQSIDSVEGCAHHELPYSPDPIREQLTQEDAQLFKWDLEAALSKLQDEEHTVFRMRVQEGISAQDVAAALTKKPDNIRQIQHRAILKIRQHMVANGWGHLQLRDMTRGECLEKIRSRDRSVSSQPSPQKTVRTKGMKQ